MFRLCSSSSTRSYYRLQNYYNCRNDFDKSRITKLFKSTSTSARNSKNFGTYSLRSNTWVAFFSGVIGGALYVSFRKECENNEGGILLKLYRIIPLKITSRCWGSMNDIELPLPMRKPILQLYSWLFGCNLEEAVIQDLNLYSNLGQFFKRRIKSNLRPVNYNFCLVSPCDGKILHLGKANKDLIEQVKNSNYSICDFLGDQSWINENHTKMNVKNMSDVQRQKYVSNLKSNPDNDIYHCVLYLAPGDYHGFHSPSNWVVNFRRHIPGELLSVNPGVCRIFKGIFNLNERVAYIGSWEQGFMSMTAVGATNVGSIHVNIDKTLKSNLHKNTTGQYIDKDFRIKDIGGLLARKGLHFGEFHLGSTIVLIFEAPKNFAFFVEPGDKIKYGKPLGCYKNKTDMIE